MSTSEGHACTSELEWMLARRPLEQTDTKGGFLQQQQKNKIKWVPNE